MTSDQREVAVPPWVVAYAISYGLTRRSYAFGDAIRLLREHWPILARYRLRLDGRRHR